MNTQVPLRSRLTPAGTGITLILLLFFLLLPVRAGAQGTEETTVGGYGELHYNEPDGPARGQLDFHRFVLYLSHTFSERVTFQSELELEHTRIEAGEDEGGEIAIEQAYLDWAFAGSTGLRAGIVLIPMGIINERHEPPTFNGVERPNVDRTIIPTTWREAGLGLFGNFSAELRYQAYVVAGLKAEGFSGSGGIRGGRQEGFGSDPVNPSFAGRLDYVAGPGLRIGASAFAGNTTGGDASMGSGTLALLSGDGEFREGGLGIRAVGVYGSLGDADRINAVFTDSSGSFTKNIADSFYGWYAEGAYDIMPRLDPASGTSLVLFVRYERYNTQAGVTGFAADPRNDRNEITVGATLKPTYNTAFKVDYQFLNNAADLNTRALNFGIGYQFN